MAEDYASQLQAFIDRMNAGDPAARGELIARSCDGLRRLVRKMFPPADRLRRYEDTDDVLQNSVLRLARALEAVPLTSAVEFFRLAAVQIRRELHDLARHHFGPEGDGANHASVAPGSTGGSGAPPADQAQSTDEPSKLAFWTEFHARVESLPPDERAVVDLLWYQGLTQDEAAQVLGVSVPTVKRRWAAARMKLGEMLRDAG